ncbi:MAG: glycerate kinase [Shewanella algae]
MKIVIAPDSFKESLSALEVAGCIRDGFRQVFPNAEYCLLPLADGGEGTVDVLMHSLKGMPKCSLVTGPGGAKLDAEWALLDDSKTALIEIAQASGLDKVPPQDRDPATSTSYGTGELIREALDCGVEKIVLGLGGSATNDGGSGILQALGGVLLDSTGTPISRGGAALAALERIDLSDLHPRCREVEFVVACDVTNPLCGENGASYVFGPQKGAGPAQVTELESALEHFADVATGLSGVNHRDSTGFGAAGGAPLGLSLAFDIRIQPGIEMVLDTVDADAQLEGCSLLITGEGQIDNQTLQGKTPFGIARRAKARGIPVIAISGSLGKEVDELYACMDSFFGTVRSPQPLSQVLQEAQLNLTRTARNIASTLLTGHQLLTSQPSLTCHHSHSTQSVLGGER